LLFVPAAPTASGLFRTAMALRLEPALIQRTGNRLDVIAAYAIGTVAAFWLIKPISAFFYVRPQRLLRRALEVRLTTSGFGTFETCPPILRMSVHRRRPEVAVDRSNRRE